jgi:hypothetical protein
MKREIGVLRGVLRQQWRKMTLSSGKRMMMVTASLLPW